MRTRRRETGGSGSEWQLQEAKNRLSEVVRRSQDGGPQTITLHGKPMAVVVSYESFRRMACPRMSLSRFIMASPLAGVDLDIERPAEPSREIDL